MSCVSLDRPAYSVLTLRHRQQRDVVHSLITPTTFSISLLLT